MKEYASLSEKADIAFLTNGTHEEIMQLLNSASFKGFSAATSQLFIERGNSEEIKCYLVFHPLPERGQLALLKRGFHAEIMLCVKYHKFHPSSEKTFIRRGVHEEIMAYLEKFPLFPESIVALIQRARPEEIEKAAQKGSFDEKGELELIDFGIHRLIMFYIKHRKLQPKAQKALFLRGNPTEISLYKKLYNA